MKIINACAVIHSPKKSIHLGPRIPGREPELRCNFPDLNMIELKGKTQYSAAWSHALKNDQGFHTQHSLIASLIQT
jgi:hypothetical protein